MYIFLEQSAPTYSPTKIITTVKSLLAPEIFSKHPEVKQKLWGGEFWSDGYFVNTVSKIGEESSKTKNVEIKDWKRNILCSLRTNN